MKKITELKTKHKYYLLDWLINGKDVLLDNPFNNTTIIMKIVGLERIYAHIELNMISSFWR